MASSLSNSSSESSLSISSNPCDAPGCLKIVADNGQDLLIQTDWDYPGIASTFGWSIGEVQPETRISAFNRFELPMPKDCACDCHHQGVCDEDVAYWAKELDRPKNITPELLKAELKEYGAWDNEQLNDDSANWKRLIWIAAGNLQEDTCKHDKTDGTVDCPDCGLTASQFISAAREWLDDNDGAQAEDPGYFS